MIFQSLFLSLLLGASPAEAESPKPLKVMSLLTPPEARPTEPSLGVMGLEIAVQNTPASRPVEFIHVFAERSAQALAVQTAEMIQKHQPDVIIGGSTSNAAFVISDLAEKNQIPFVTPQATHPSLLNEKRFSFRVCFDDNYQAVELARFAINELEGRRVLVLYNTTETYAVSFQNVFQKEARRLGVDEIKIQGFADERDVTKSMLDELQAFEPDLVILPSYQLETVAILSRLIPVLSRDVKYIGPDSWGAGDHIARLFQTQFEFTPKAYVFTHWSKEFASEPNETFLRRLAQHTDPAAEDLSSLVPLSYDAMQAVLWAAHQAEEKQLSLVRALEQTEFEGATGRISFREGSQSKIGVYVYRYQAEDAWSFMRSFP